jgi:general L-amino acid transport system permease protein
MSDNESTRYEAGTHPSLAPPATAVGVIGWMRQNLFSSWANSLLTLLGLYLVYTIFTPIIEWAFVNANWSGSSREACTSGGACWVFVAARFQQFMYGFYPEGDYWRVNLAAGLLVFVLAWLMIPPIPHKRIAAVLALVVFPVVAFILLSGGVFGLEHVETSKWGGLTLTLVLALVGMVAALPLGILLALGRRSQMPVVRTLCVAFIELWRGVPLITVLFMSSVMLPLFLPEGVNFDKLLRALIGIALFQSAYMAEVVRGGLQAIPKGQYEAADALGLNYAKKMGLVVLPQALKLVIPGIVNTFIALFKDTSLVLIIGLFDLLEVIKSALADPNWLGFAIEGYVFAALVYWIFCFGMSRYSQFLERKLHTGHKR